VTGWPSFSGTDETEARTLQDAPVFYQEDKVANVAMMAGFANTPLYLVALFKWRDLAVYEDGRATTLSGFEADRLYTQAMFSTIVPGVGGEVKFIANIEKAEVVKDSSENDFNMDWDALVAIEFPSGLAFARMLTNQQFKDLSPNKKAGLQFHAIFACELEEGSFLDPVVDVGRNDVLTDAVAEVELLEYKRFADYKEGDEDSARFRSGKDAAQKYFDTAANTAADHGMQTIATFKVRQSLIQGSAGWDQVRINSYPSHAAMDAAKADPETNNYHFEAGVNRANAFQVSPVFVNSLGGNDVMSYLDACATDTRREVAALGNYDLAGYCPSP